ncbi:MAG: bifunctional [glutamate--ammonia ligase]-adenylyl-L-tyrosine phosphorylase/[glutamate--ammonia-ligase] adenylyltransferase, partial [Burkholderiales bacterium]
MPSDCHSYSAAPHSGFFRRLCDGWTQHAPDRIATLEALVAAPLDDATVEHLLEQRVAEAAHTVSPTATGMRQARQLLQAALMEREARGQATLDEVCRAMTIFGERCVQRALDAASEELTARYGVPLDGQGRPQDLLVVGMGKAGGYELNVSSDIDLVFLYRDQGTTAAGEQARSQLAASEYFARLGRHVIQLLDEVDGNGFVFRVDMRLRPHGDSGPLVVSLPMLEDYLITQGREWERFAWLKGRVIATTRHGGDEIAEDLSALESLITPFVFRRYLDYSAFDALRDLHGKIRAEVAKREARHGGIDVKLGRGGIREVEFCAQLFQIVRGGRDPGLRDRSTLATLAAIAQRGLMPEDDCERLAAAYEWLRRVEHALQFRNDAQTHVLTQEPAMAAEAAGLLGVTPETLIERLERAREHVAAVFDALLADTSAQAPAPAPATADLPEAVRGRVRALRESRRYLTVRSETRDTLERLLARATTLFPGDPDGSAQSRLIDLFDTVLGRPSYLSLLDRFPQALSRLARLLAGGKWAADYVIRHPIVLDELLDGQLMEPVDFGLWMRELRAQLEMLRFDDQADTERQMDLIREAHHAQLFRILAQDLEGRHTVEHVSDLLSELADRVVGLSMDLVWQQLPRRHHDEPAFAVIGYGRLGGKELGYASDLDLVFLYDDPDAQAIEIYSQFGRRLMSWLSTRTAAGIVFEVDLRLRPNGEAGMLVSSVEGFDSYQHDSAWVWEHQALTRARCVAGDAAIGTRFE